MPEISTKQRGAIMAEFAIAAPVLIVLAFGIIELGTAIFTLNTLHKAARDSARYLSNQTSPADAQAEAKVEAMMRQLPVFYPNNSTAVTINRNYAVSGLQHVRVQVDYDHQFLLGQALNNLLPLIGGGNIGVSLPLQSIAVMRFRDEEF